MFPNKYWITTPTSKIRGQAWIAPCLSILLTNMRLGLAGSLSLLSNKGGNLSSKYWAHWRTLPVGRGGPLASKDFILNKLRLSVAKEGSLRSILTKWKTWWQISQRTQDITTLPKASITTFWPTIKLSRITAQTIIFQIQWLCRVAFNKNYKIIAIHGVVGSLKIRVYPLMCGGLRATTIGNYK